MRLFKSVDLLLPKSHFLGVNVFKSKPKLNLAKEQSRSHLICDARNTAPSPRRDSTLPAEMSAKIIENPLPHPLKKGFKMSLYLL